MTCSILLVEDEKWVRTAIRKVIEKIGPFFSVVHEAPNGIEALDWLEANEADLILTDIRMPVMDGLALLEAVRERGVRAEVILISGHDDFAYAQQALRLGALDYVLKPVEKEDLGRSFDAWLRRKEQLASKETERNDIGIQDMSAVEQVVHHIETKRAFHMTSSEAAEMVHLNPSYFSKLFKQTKGMTYTDYVTAMKIKEAVRLLEHTSLRLTEIGERLGFADPAYFSNTFKKIVGSTPSDYRRRFREHERQP